MNNKKRSGVLLPLFSLPGKYGIGSLGQYCKKFIDFLSESKFSYWEVLPINMTNIEGSPYNLVDAFGTNYLYIDIDELIKEGLLNSRDIKGMNFCNDARNVNYPLVFETHRKLLFKAYKRDNLKSKYFKECINNKEIKEYAIYMTLKEKNNFKAWYDWELEDRYYCKEVEEYVLKNEEKLYLFYVWTQAKFKEQWDKIHDYAKSKNISLVGEISHFLGYDSCQMYMHPELFLVDKRNQITHVSGFPKDEFSNVGQKWGNPLYDWKKHKETGYAWWIQRIAYCKKAYDVVRIDHFRGFDEYFSIPYGDTTARNGHWEKGPGYDLFKTVEESLGKLNVIAEDLGYLTDTVKQMVADCGYPGMKVFEFAFDSRDSSGTSNYLPYNYTENSVVYTGTHDNETMIGWLKNILPEERQMLKDYLHYDGDDDAVLVDMSIDCIMASVSDKCIVPMQDYLKLDNTARMNKPNTLGNNWMWRLDKNAFSDSLKERMRDITVKTNRI